MAFDLSSWRGLRILVCGGRDYANASLVASVLYDLAPVLVIHGAAPGADRLADVAARRLGVQVLPFPVSKDDWKAQGRAAGPLRNRRMLLDGRPQLVVAFPGGRGTADMTSQAELAKVAVLRVRDSGEVEVGGPAHWRYKAWPGAGFPPGSSEAVLVGCKCPILDNAHGEGAGGNWWVSSECRLHAGGGAPWSDPRYT